VVRWAWDTPIAFLPGIIRHKPRAKHQSMQSGIGESLLTREGFIGTLGVIGVLFVTKG